MTQSLFPVSVTYVETTIYKEYHTPKQVEMPPRFPPAPQGANPNKQNSYYNHQHTPKAHPALAQLACRLCTNPGQSRCHPADQPCSCVGQEQTCSHWQPAFSEPRTYRWHREEVLSGLFLPFLSGFGFGASVGNSELVKTYSVELNRHRLTIS